MALSGHSRELSLPDLVQANALGRNTCRILVATADGKGVLYMQDGAVVHASYGNLSGRDAFFAIIAADNAFFQAESGLSTVFRTIEGDWQGLMMEAMRLRDEGKLPTASFAQRQHSGSEHDDNVRPFPGAPVVLPPAEASARRASRLGWMLPVAAVLLAAVVAGTMLLRPEVLPSQAALASASVEVVEASALTGPGDEPPRLLEAVIPRSPDPTLAVSPTIVCRLLIDAQGEVKETAIYRSRLDLAAFEEEALVAARRLRFAPGVRQGKVVAVRINWPIVFD